MHRPATWITRATLSLLCSFALFACGKGSTSADGAPGAPGAPGANGASCTSASSGDGNVTISCTDGTSATVKGGANGSSCTVLDNGNGTRTITCGAASVTVSDAVADFSVMSAADQADANPSAVITSVTVPADGRPVVAIKVSDRKGNGLKRLAPVAPITWRFALLKLSPGSATAPGVNGSAADTWVSYLAADATSVASAESAGTNAASTSTGLLTDNNDGSYTYRFAKVITAAATAGTSYEADKVHRLVVLLYATNNPFAPINVVKDFIPATGADVTGQNDKVDPASCLECHTRFRAVAGSSTGFHGGSRYDVRGCVACHNDQRRFTAIPGTGSTPAANDASIAADGTWAGNLTVVNGEAIVNLPVFIHKIHMGADLKLTGGSYTSLQFPAVTYPQDARACAKCHTAPAAKAANWMQPSRRACNACHDNVSFAINVPPGRVAHIGGPQTDDHACLLCHGTNLNDGGNLVAQAHVAVAVPDVNSTWAGGTNSNTNAAYLAAAGAVPPGAHKFTSLVKSVSRDGSKHPVIVFRQQLDGADLAYNAFGAKTELIDNFVGSPTLYFAWSIPQDGILAPADYNMSASGYLKRIWNGTATGTAAGTLTGPDANHDYTLTLTGVTVADNAVMLTGGVGYAYSLGTSKTSTSTNQPLTQTDLAKYPVAANGTGGLVVPAANVWVTATGYTARRAIVSTAKCNSCHEALGATPTFHAGQRNDGPTCAFCHKPNQTSSGWSASSSSFIHGIHGGAKRDNPFIWHAVSPTQTYAEVTYPGVLNDCEMCHLPGSYDFSSAATLSAYPNMLSSTVGQGRYNSSPTTNPAGYFSVAPHVASDNQTDYGYGFATSNVSATLPDGLSGTQGATVCTPAAPCTCTTASPCSVTVSAPYTVNNVAVTFSQKVGSVTTTCATDTACTCTTAAPCTGVVALCTTAAPCDAQPTTLITSPIVAACTGCHDSAIAVDHMQANGGSFYEARRAVAGKAQKEQCLLCHGSGTIASIQDMHMKR